MAEVFDIELHDDLVDETRAGSDDEDIVDVEEVSKS